MAQLHLEHVVQQATPPIPLEDSAGEDADLVGDLTFDAFAGAASTAAAPERVRTRRGGPRAPLPLLPLIGLCAGIGIAYVAQTAHITHPADIPFTHLAPESFDLISWFFQWWPVRIDHPHEAANAGAVMNPPSRHVLWSVTVLPLILL